MLIPDNYCLPENGQRHQWLNLPSFARVKAACELAVKHNTVILLIARDGSELGFYEEALKLLTKAQDEIKAIVFPDRETLPYDHFSPHPDIQSARLSALYEIQNTSQAVIACSISSLLTRLCPASHINNNSLLLSKGQTLNVKQFTAQLVDIGYQHRESVYEHGEFALRGALLDLFPMGSESPFRIELFDTEIESFRTFDTETQRSISQLDEISILPAGEIALDDEGINTFRDNWHKHFSQDPYQCAIYNDAISAIASAGIESWLPMFFEQTNSLLDYLPEGSSIIGDADLEKLAKAFLSEAAHRFEQHSIDPTRPLLAPKHLYLAIDEFFSGLNAFSRISVSNLTDSNQEESISPNAARGEHSFLAGAIPDLLIDEHSEKPLAALAKHIETTEQKACYLLCVESVGRRELLIEKLADENIVATAVDSWKGFESICHTNHPEISDVTEQVSISIIVSALHEGARFAEPPVYVIAEAELFGVRSKPAATKKATKSVLTESAINSLIELREDALIVHVDHGVGRYKGLQHMPVPIAPGKSIDAEFLTLEYAQNDKLYVPVTSLHLISRYMGGEESSTALSRLGSESWENTRKKAIANIRDVAAELLAIYAKRKSMSGFAHQLDEPEYRRFADQFPFEETEDQLQAINAVLSDMQADTAMDRLICGDVGFGKTEVAIRAAFVAAQNSKQVMLLVPTTLLSQQHYQNFVDRFADWPVRIDTLSRFRTSSEQKKVLAGFADGSIDILIGTHKLIQQSIKVKDLGLVIVDEEHRFGVRQKDQLKKLCANVDLLTMTATPIPRTLNMAMAGLRDLSIIATPPARRLSVKTFVLEKQASLVKEAILRELLRGGQVFYLRNDVASIERTKRELEELVPEARIAIGHGQMPERELEKVMADFYHKKFNILLCTTIIETGIDIPNANTIIIERANKFGLAQLHQLRGRVGRSHHQAYAYLFIPNRKLLTKDAEKRLEAIEEAQDLGAGFMLATHDLEIRGAGELLGDEQSGQIQSIGFSLYLDMLERAVSALKAGEEIDLETTANPQGEINLHVSAIIPDDYLPDIHNRLMMYKRISSASSTDELRDLQIEMIDRFGLLTQEIKNLFAIMTIKLAAVPLGIAKVDLGAQGGHIEFNGNTSIDPMKIVTLVQENPENYQLKSATRLNIAMVLNDDQARIQWLHEFILQLNTAK